MGRIRVKLFIFPILLFAWLANSANAGMVVSSSFFAIELRDNQSDYGSFAFKDVSFPFSATHTGTTSGSTSGIASYDFNVSGNNGDFHADVDLIRSGAENSQVIASGQFYFQVSELSSFDIGGLWNISGRTGLFFYAQVRDLTVGGGPEGYVFSSLQESLNTPDESFQIGGSGGDSFNLLVGSAPGYLIAEHEYLFQYGFQQAYGNSNPSSASSSSGSIDFNIKPGAPPVSPSPISEPSTLALCGIGALGVGLVVRRRKKLNA